MVAIRPLCGSSPRNRVIEVGNILYTPRVQRTVAATEEQYLIARYVFDDLGYRRYEWKCNALNAPSRRAAERFGFTFEGVFRQHMVVKGEFGTPAGFPCSTPTGGRDARLSSAGSIRAILTRHGRQKVSLSELMPRTAP